MNEIERNHIRIYEFPDYDEEEENTKKKLKVRDSAIDSAIILPFSRFWLFTNFCISKHVLLT